MRKAEINLNSNERKMDNNLPHFSFIFKFIYLVTVEITKRKDNHFAMNKSDFNQLESHTYTPAFFAPIKIVFFNFHWVCCLLFSSS